MATVTNLVPIRIDVSSTDGAVRIIETLLIDTNCLPISNSNDQSRESIIEANISSKSTPSLSLSSLIDRNSTYLTESILTDAEVYGAVRSSRNYLGGRLDLLSDTQLYSEIKDQIDTQLSVALNLRKDYLIRNRNSSPFHSDSVSLHQAMPDVRACKVDREHNAPDFISSSMTEPDANACIEQNSTYKQNLCFSSNIVRINLCLRQENIAVVDSFDYDINLSGIEGSDPFSISTSIVEDLKLPPEFTALIATSIVEQIYGIDVPSSTDRFLPGIDHNIPAAFVLDVSREGSSTGFAQMLLDS